ncbi:MAG: lysophospholipid acyltransferase family protein [Prevotella sp.]
MIQDTLVYRIVLGFFRGLSRLPFSWLYALADIGYVIVYHLARYRRKVVRKNLQTSFPDMGENEIRKTEKAFYHWFCDYIIESVKLLTISNEELRRRFTINNAEAVEECFRNGQNAAGILGHYCNWEWLSCVGIALPPERRVGLIYHPLRNPVFDRLFIDIRSSQPSGLPVPKKEILRKLIELKRQGHMSIFGYIADQGPKWDSIHLWLPFLGHDTPVFTGAERIMRKMDNAVFYVEMSRPRRGYYTCTFKPIAQHAAKTEEFAITRQFFALLEETIRKAPQFYLWSHKRWKRTHEEFDRRFRTVNGKVVLRNDDNVNKE